ncbi:uncharacterized protein TRIADDRAFT_24890 [Trichoplax adhaerens]|uniref:Dynein heavy chain, cytosolic n=1 Tax=Trichoplax adhaerens TaxID=10228 RepID=B3RXD8_TRIAD|nr:hypothetical protein TRIADDRAFT_24890 [Trichoplax adhaerens]EDV24404.1 hypothetical protein TRIADDRAFT_24890 [Trichoplax adhaerens]|eukprot:XP_002112294.1 hypothetical protein TRIADDRAFT_24890 [Trichoplax adhaerens]
MDQPGDQPDGGVSAEDAESQAVILADVGKVEDFICRTVSLLLEDGLEKLAPLKKVLSEDQSRDQLKKFISDVQVTSFFVQRTLLKEEIIEEGDEAAPTEESNLTVEDNIVYSVSIVVQYSSTKVSSVVFIKRGAVIEDDKTVSSQLRIIDFSDGSLFETLHSLMSNAMSPYFKSYVRSVGSGNREASGDKVLPSVEKKMAELEMGFLNLQQNIDIPEVNLIINPSVLSVMKKCSEEDRKPQVADFGAKVQDSSFLNALQNGVNRWIKEIQKVTKLDRDPASGTALQEISFWLNLERALQRIQEKRESTEITLTLDILKHGKRFHATVSFDTDTGLKQAVSQVNDYITLMKDFPLNDLLSVSELDRMSPALGSIFAHLRKIRSTKYPVQRALRLVEAISRDLSNQVLKILSTRRLMHMNIDEFEKVMTTCFEIFVTWDDEYDKLQSLLRDIVKKKREESLKMVWRTNPAHKRLQSRLDHMRKFRHQHEQLRVVIIRVLKPVGASSASLETVKVHGNTATAVADGTDGDDSDAIMEVNLAYESVKEIDCLDVSKEGNDNWEAAIVRYDERIDRVETRIATRLRDQLGTAKNANEMFRIFSRFNALFVRPHIRGAIREYQTQLIQRVKDDIEFLHDKFKIQYVHSMAYRMSKVRDLPPVSGSIIWAKQIDRQLTAYLRRVEDVLGKGWENHVDGQKLKSDGDNFRQKLNPHELFEDWARKVQGRNLGVSGKIYSIESQRARVSGRPNYLKLRVSFSPDIITLSKEARNLKALGFRVPLAILNKAHQANQMYPFAISLIESIKTYEQTCDKVDAGSSISPLVAGLKKDVQSLIAEGASLVWESYKLDPYVQRLAVASYQFQEKVDDLLMMEERIDADVRSLENCEYNLSTFENILDKIQKVVDELNLHSYTNLSSWVSSLDSKVEKVLGKRLQISMQLWTDCLKGIDFKDVENKTEIKVHTGGKPVLKVLVHEIRIKNQVLYLNPPHEEARSNLLKQLHNWLSVVLSQSRIKSSRYQVSFDRYEDYEDYTYRAILARLPDGSSVLEDAYNAIEKKLDEVKGYVHIWLQYQSLWDMEGGFVYDRLGNDLGLWMRLLNDIKKARATFDNSETKKDFTCIVIDYGQVQSKVNLKYDSWHKDILSKFGGKLGGDMQSFFTTITKSRTELESHSVEGATTAEAVGFITFMQGLKRKLKVWEKQVETYKGGQKLLERQRFQFPTSWLYYDNVEGEWNAFNDILKRKDAAIQTQVAVLQEKIVSEDRVVEARTNDLLGEWEKGKPIAGDIKPDAASASLAIFDGKFVRLREERDNLNKAREALELHEQTSLVAEDRLSAAYEELMDLKGVWAELSKVWEQINELKEKTWLSIQPRKLRQSLDGLLNLLKGLPSRLRQYASYEYVQNVLRSYVKANVLVTELKSDSLKERHWKMLMKSLRVSWILSELSLGQVWDVDLLRHEPAIKDILIVAQGEMALEEFLKQVRDTWQSYELDLINYQNKCRIIRGWDDLFNKLKEHINSVAAMKLSPYYKVFEEDALAWEDKLNRINAIFDIWIDVQRRWVYLEGIFSGSADIKHLLPTETSRFTSISTEFLGLMKKVAKSPLVLDVLSIQGVQRSLERLADLLGKIQKALGEYLERERASFPRFYFVGDEDLLDIIGNSKNVTKLQKHFKKMFAGVAALIINEDETAIKGIVSREGEEVMYLNPVILKDKKINEWLTQVESEMRMTLAKLLARAVSGMQSFKNVSIPTDDYLKWIDSYQAQLVTLASQIAWSENIEAALEAMASKPDDSEPIENVLKIVKATLGVLANCVLQEQPPVRRKKMEHLITELVHQRDVTRSLMNIKVTSAKAFEWLQQMRFYFDPNQSEVLKQLTIRMANASFYYGFEYLGVSDKLVQTPLTDRCYLTMTQALDGKYGGSPFGPAGTGKTESVKALGNQLGRFVLVFNCDETFDFQAMGRIFVGLCQVGAWGCFDEFNRLEERMLSAVSQQIQTIQEALKEKALRKGGDKSGPIQVELIGKNVKVSEDMAIFITMNPGYAGRSNLPDNLKKLFRNLAMTKPDRQLIAQVMLYSQGFRTAEVLASKVVPFFRLCQEQLSAQSHYDFGLRALKSVLVSAGNVKRDRIQSIKEDMKNRGEEVDEGQISENLPEQEILIQSICETMVPKLVADDIPLLHSLLSDVFPGVAYTQAEMAALKAELKKVCAENHLVYGEGDEIGGSWVEKVLQLFQISNLSHGLMMVGPSGSGKSTAWKTLLKALERLEGVEGVAHVIDPKAISKDDLYGFLDPNTREWTDGLFTHVLRKIIDNVRGEIGKRQWIIFDGDVDPEWVENLNSVLDDNKLLTLPNGERLGIPPNVRIMFEVQDLKYATLATVSRCGMVWFSEDVLTCDMIFQNFLLKLRNVAVDENEDDIRIGTGAQDKEEISSCIQVQRDCAAIIEPFFTADGIIMKAIHYAVKLDHIMEFTRLRCLGAFFSMVNQSVRNILSYNQSHPDFPLPKDQMERYIQAQFVYSLVWTFSGDCKLKARGELSDYLRSITTIPLPPGNNSLIDYEVSITGEWQSWQSKVPQIEVETHKVAAPDVVVPTVDTVRHESLLYTWLAEHKPLVLCGPPGSGKTMTLFSALRALPDMEVVGLNFSSATTPELMLKTFDHYCEYKKTPNGTILSPIQLGRWLVLFCDEINLPAQDKYGTQRVISFIRQMVEHNGFYRISDHTWVTLDRIQFVGACNPPTDPGRVPMSHRFLRHVPVVYVDYPGPASLSQIYGTFNRAMLRLVPNLRTYAQPLTEAMVEFYTMSQERFTPDMQPHYIYSPREMTRWVRGILEALRPVESLSVEGLVRVWAHEALRLFQDRLVFDEERKWTDDNIDNVSLKHFPGIEKEAALGRPILFSNWLSKDYTPVDREELREYVKARLKVFYEEELDVPLVLFNEVLDHVLRIDRIFKQTQGHLLFIGVSGAGKTTLSRFVAWMNGMSMYQIKVHNKYTGDDFDEDLRVVLRRAGTKDEKIVFILDESNVLDSGFLERMNTLLANGEVPGLFEGDEHTTLMTQCKEGSQRDGHMLDSNEELYKWFTNQVCRNLHVVFTMNPSEDGLKDRAATSPALFNRCVLNWFGDWSWHAYYQVGREFTDKLDLERSDYIAPEYFPVAYEGVSIPPTHREAIVNGFVYVHQTLHKTNDRERKRGNRTMAITPRHYLDFINQYVKLHHEKRADLEEQQLHLNVGLQKIRDTVDQVEELQKSLAIKSRELEAKNDAANQKLKQMVKDQQEAEQKKVEAQDVQVRVETQTKEIAERREVVEEDLAKVEPAVKDAAQAVKSIKKQHLVEVRSMGNPPVIVKMALESICLLLGENTTDWKAIRGVLMKDNFIGTIVNFTTENMSDSIRRKMDKYLNDPNYNFEKVNRASAACGPLVKWAIAQCGYAEMLQKVEPLRNELRQLEKQANVNKAKKEELEKTVTQLEKSIAMYKEEYAKLISEAQAIKADKESVEAKVTRSQALLRSLSSERERWESTSNTFKTQMSTIVGDVLLSAAFMAYAGYFDQQLREYLWSTLSNHLHQAGVLYRSDLALTEYLCTPDDRLRWQANSLPADDLCNENAIMLQRFNRYPLIIDPSGQATAFLLQEFKDKKITRTSFLDDAFRKNLESALRFGNPLLVQDVESYDPILNPVLNKEVRRNAGRVLITIGDQDIDLSPAFTIFLSTRDPTVEFPPDVCSRVTFVNFTVTHSSLQSQCLNKVLKAERPDIDAKRSDLLKLQGEYKLRLRQLEKSLLQALNDSKGRILDDDSVITTLETLKKEAAEISNKVEETDTIMAEVETVSKQYRPLALSCSSIYFTIDRLHQMHFLYQYSLHFFLAIFENVLYDNSHLKGITGHAERLKVVTDDLFQIVYNRVARGMLHEDRIAFAMLLAQIFVKGISGSVNLDEEFNHLLRGNEFGQVDQQGNELPGLNREQSSAIHRISKLHVFKDVGNEIVSQGEDFTKWLQSNSPELNVPILWKAPTDKHKSPFVTALYQLLLIASLRPDRILRMSTLFVQKAINEKFLQEADLELNLGEIVDKEIKPSTPVLLCSVPGYDASSRVDDLAAEQGKQCTSIAIGSAEGFTLADKAISSAAKSGRWVMLKNVHLAPQWLVQLEKKLHSLSTHTNFRLFMTLEINPKVPVNLLRVSRIFVFEPPPGVKANLLRTFSTVPSARMCKSPNERARIYFLLAWFHAIVQERLRYSPLGWSKKYEFNESDLRCGCDTLDTWLDSVSQGRSNISPNKIPWDALCTLLSQSIYGGKIDNEFDQRLMTSFLSRIFGIDSFDSEFQLVKRVAGEDSEQILVPEGIRREQFLQWIENLPDAQTPSWLGLPNNAEKVLLTARGNAMLQKLLKMQGMGETEELEPASGEEKQAGDVRPAWMRTLHTTATTWLAAVPESLPGLKRTVDNIKDPLFRFFDRECKIGISLLRTVLRDLRDVIDICAGAKKSTNHHRSIMSELTRGILPRGWSRYVVPRNTTVIQWIADFSERIKQLQKIVSATNADGAKALKVLSVDLGRLFVPEAFVTATRQFVAQANNWSLEELFLDIYVTNKGEKMTADDCSFGVTGLKLMGSNCSNNILQLSSSIATDLPLSFLKWIRRTADTRGTNGVTLPVYLNRTRSELLFTLDFAMSGEGSGKNHSFYERGVALYCSDLVG